MLKLGRIWNSKGQALLPPFWVELHLVGGTLEWSCCGSTWPRTLFAVLELWNWRGLHMVLPPEAPCRA